MYWAQWPACKISGRRAGQGALQQFFKILFRGRPGWGKKFWYQNFSGVIPEVPIWSFFIDLFIGVISPIAPCVGYWKHFEPDSGSPYERWLVVYFFVRSCSPQILILRLAKSRQRVVCDACNGFFWSCSRQNERALGIPSLNFSLRIRTIFR